MKQTPLGSKWLPRGFFVKRGRGRAEGEKTVQFLFPHSTFRVPHVLELQFYSERAWQSAAACANRYNRAKSIFRIVWVRNVLP